MGDIFYIKRHSWTYSEVIYTKFLTQNIPQHQSFMWFLAAFKVKIG